MFIHTVDSFIEVDTTWGTFVRQVLSTSLIPKLPCIPMIFAFIVRSLESTQQPDQEKETYPKGWSGRGV